MREESQPIENSCVRGMPRFSAPPGRTVRLFSRFRRGTPHFPAGLPRVKSEVSGSRSLHLCLSAQAFRKFDTYRFAAPL